MTKNRVYPCPSGILEAAVAAAEVSISITYGEQQNRQTTQVQVNQAQASQIQAGGKTTLIAGDAGEQSNINITGSDVSGKAGTGLIADNDIKLQSAEPISRPSLSTAANASGKPSPLRHCA